MYATRESAAVPATSVSGGPLWLPPTRLRVAEGPLIAGVGGPVVQPGPSAHNS